jgi:hypothetical protein
MKIQLKETFKNLDGEVLLGQDKKPFTVGNALANILLSVRSDGNYDLDKAKLFVLAQKMYSDNEIEVDDVDLKGVISMVKSDKSYGPLILGQLLLLLEK